jgi:nucleoside-diphosphate-sugar epimerase
MKKILVTGAIGQIGSELVTALRAKFGENNVIASDLKKSAEEFEPFEILDVLDKSAIENVVKKHNVGTI